MDPGHPTANAASPAPGPGRLAMAAAGAGVVLPIPDPTESARLLQADTSLASDLPAGHRSGFVALIGRPNVGKSTLVNRLVGEKVAITSPVAQTTRHRLRAILTTASAQLVLLDTPGIHKPHHLLGERLVQTARSCIGDVDVVLLLMDGSQAAGRGDSYIVELLRHCRAPVLVALNKHDLVAADRAEALSASYRELLEARGAWAAPTPQPPLDWPLHPVSALTGAGSTALVDALSAALPPGPRLYPTDAVSDQPERLLLAELIREQVLCHTREEVPHSVAVSVDRVVEDGPRTAVLATVVVERPSQKAILIGKGGRMLRTIGQGARLQMQKLLAGPVYLELFVKVVPGWRGSAARLAEFGYRGE
ncbi:MAG: GTPase Era [Cyanobacteriota bacterium]|nr:GTPase Era [Cyanobacteriota bacterium]